MWEPHSFWEPHSKENSLDSEHLEAYSDYIKDLSQQFGSDAWGIIYKADCRMRSEFMERI